MIDPTIDQLERWLASIDDRRWYVDVYIDRWADELGVAALWRRARELE